MPPTRNGATSLDPGDILVFYSDGFSETANSEGEFFGTDRLRDLISASADLSASQLADRILNEVEEFSASARAVDDRTLVVLKVKPDSFDPVG